MDQLYRYLTRCHTSSPSSISEYVYPNVSVDAASFEVQQILGSFFWLSLRKGRRYSSACLGSENHEPLLPLWMACQSENKRSTWLNKVFSGYVKNHGYQQFQHTRDASTSVVSSSPTSEFASDLQRQGQTQRSGHDSCVRQEFSWREKETRQRLHGTHHVMPQWIR